MTKGKYGLSMIAVAILAFVLAFFGFLEALILFLAFALILEKDQWLSRQVFQAFYLRLAYSVLLTVIGWFFTAINAFFGLFDAYRIINAFNGIHNVIRFLLHIGLFVMALVAVLKLAKGNDAGLPFISNLVDATFGLIKKKTKPQPQSQTAYQQPVTPAPSQPAAAPQQQPQPQQTQEQVARQPQPRQEQEKPVQSVYAPPPQKPTPAEPVSVQPEKPEAAPQPEEAEQLQEPDEGKQEETKAPSSEPEKPESWTCSCGRVNTGNFCMNCGKPRPS
jgi:hypothetical protein